MRIAEGLPTKGASASSVVTIGVFDGLHLGHQSLLQRVLDVADDKEAESVVLTFRQHPDALLRGEAPRPIMPLDARLDGLSTLGIDTAFVLNFDETMMSMRAEDFADDVLRDGLACEALVLGHDSAICKKREGTAERFRDLGIDAARVDRFTIDGSVVSASSIRDALGRGDIACVNTMLGRTFALRGVVVHGDGRGHELGFPTANVTVPDQCLPAHGVYAVRAIRTGLVYAAVANLGVRPTFEAGDTTLEAHLLTDSDGYTFDDDLYGDTLRLEFVARIREERSFSNVDELKRQIQADIEVARGALR